MNFYWIYDIPQWQFFLLANLAGVAFCILGPLFWNKWVQRKLGVTEEQNETIGVFVSISGVLYGVTLGLLAVGTYENFRQVEERIHEEVSAINAMYRDVTCLKGTGKAVLKHDLEHYVENIITVAWPLQQKGLLPTDGIKIMGNFVAHMTQYDPVDEKDEMFYAELFDQFNVLIEKRRSRLNSVNASLPAVVWIILLVGGVVNIFFTWLLVLPNRRIELVLNSLIGILFGSLIFLIISMDNPYRGEFSVTSDPYKLLLETIIR